MQDGLLYQTLFFKEFPDGSAPEFVITVIKAMNGNGFLCGGTESQNLSVGTGFAVGHGFASGNTQFLFQCGVDPVFRQDSFALPNTLV